MCKARLGYGKKDKIKRKKKKGETINIDTRIFYNVKIYKIYHISF